MRHPDVRRLLLLTALAAGAGGFGAAGTAALTAAGTAIGTRAPPVAAASGLSSANATARAPRATGASGPGRVEHTTSKRAETPRAAASRDVSDSWTGLPLTVRVVDGDTGAPLAGAVRLLHTTMTPSTLRQLTRGARARIEHGPLHFDGTTHGLARTFARPDSSPPLQFDVDPPLGYMLASPGPVGRREHISRFARSLRVTIPLRRAVEVDLDIRAESGHRLTRQLREIVAHVGGERYVLPTHPPHRVRVPFLRGEEFHAVVRTRSSWVEVRAPLVSTSRMTLPVRLPRRRDGQPTVGHYRGPAGDVPGCRLPRPWSGSAVLDVWTRRFDGSPAAGAVVRLQARVERDVSAASYVDDSGHARFTGLPAGTYDLRIAEPGFVTTTAHVTLGEGDAQALTLDEGPGVLAEIHVRNPRGLPLPFARVLVSADRDHVGLDADGTQHLDRHTDSSGRCVIERMTPRPTGISVSWAGLRASARWTPGPVSLGDEPLLVTIPERVYLTER